MIAVLRLAAAWLAWLPHAVMDRLLFGAPAGQAVWPDGVDDDPTGAWDGPRGWDVDEAWDPTDDIGTVL